MVKIEGRAQMDLYEAIYVRKSVKSFLMEEIDNKILGNIENFVNHLQPIINNQELKYQIISVADDRMKILRYVSNIKAPYYFILTMDKQEGYLLDAGFIMGQIVLYMTTKELGSFLLRPDELVIREKSHTESFIVIMAFGKTTGNRFKDTKKVKSFITEKNCYYKSEVDENIKKIVGVTAFVSNTVGLQHWRLVVNRNRIHIFGRKDTVITKHYYAQHRMEIGMMLANIQLKAEELWLNVSAKHLDNIAEKPIKNYEYIISVIIS